MDLSGADLTDANLGNADMAGSRLINSMLSGANLSNADLSGANIQGAALQGANLSDAKLTGASMAGARLSGTVFEPKSLPELTGIAAAKDLEWLTYHANPVALVQLRKEFQDGGFREEERKLTYAVKRREAELSGRGWMWFNKVLFDWTCQYGMSPGRPLLWGFTVWLLCSVIYWVCIHRPGKAGLYLIYGRTTYPSKPRPSEKISAGRTAQFRSLPWVWLRRVCHELALLIVAMSFSLMSAFNIGFRDMNFGRWLRLLTLRELNIKAEGWLRTMAGLQSLISVYLIALWVLTYFGRPFG
jgi:hypothetical protein